MFTRGFYPARSTIRAPWTVQGVSGAVLPLRAVIVRAFRGSPAPSLPSSRIRLSQRLRPRPRPASASARAFAPGLVPHPAQVAPSPLASSLILRDNATMAPKDRKRPALPVFVVELGMHGAKKRYPDGRKLTREERACLPLIVSINEGVRAASELVATTAKSPDAAWLIKQFLNPVPLAGRKKVKLPSRPLLLKAIAHLEAIYEAGDLTLSATHTPSEPKKHLLRAIDSWFAAFDERAEKKQWKNVEGTPVTLEGLRRWQADLATMDLTVIPYLTLPPEFERALTMVEAWDDVLDRRGHIGERFSLREEVLRLHNWPGDQWRNGDDYASAQKRFHRRLKKARALAQDPIRDAIMLRALYLREGLLLGPVDPLDWFLAVCQFRWAVPEMLDMRPELMTWKLVDWLARLATPIEHVEAKTPKWARSAASPVDVPEGMLEVVSGPDLMIDLDEDVVTALPPGCRVRRLIASAHTALGPDWTVYWVDSEWENSRPILNLVESAKLHPQVVFVSDEQPAELAEKIRPFLDRAYEIPTNPLTAHSHIPGVMPIFPEHPDAGL